MSIVTSIKLALLNHVTENVRRWKTVVWIYFVGCNSTGKLHVAFLPNVPDIAWVISTVIIYLSNFYCYYIPDIRSHGGWFATRLKIGPSYMNNDSSVSRTHCMAWGVLLNLLLPVSIRCQILRCWSYSLALKKCSMAVLSRIPTL